jgi:hypothetical protein
MQTVKILSLIFGLAFLTAACGDSKSSLNPTAPSAVSPGSLNVEASAAHFEAGSMAGPKPGNGNGNNGGANGNGNGNGGGNGASKVEFEGLLQAVGGSSITVNGQLIRVTAQTVIRHGNRRFELSDLRVGDRVHVRATGVPASLEAAEIKVQKPGDAAEPGQSEPAGQVFVTALDATAIEGEANPGVFRLTRTGTAMQLQSAVTVNFTLTGTAVSGTDYATLPLTASFAANQASVDVTVNPLVDGATETAETVILTLTSAAPFELGSPSAATVDLTDAPSELVSVRAMDPDASESGDTGRFVLMRDGELLQPLTITVTFTGSAVNGSDYETLSTTLTFGANVSFLNVYLVPKSDLATDPSESVILTVVDGANYDLGAASTATVTISGT